MKTLFVPAAAFLVLATAAIAQPEATPGAENQTVTKGEQKNERLVCRYVEANTGSRLSGRTRQCLTADQWRALSRR